MSPDNIPSQFVKLFDSVHEDISIVDAFDVLYVIC
jgi:hypothetical protein